MASDLETRNPLLAMAVSFCDRDPIAGAHALEALSVEQALEVLEALRPNSLQKLLPQVAPSFISSTMSGDQATRAAPILEKGGADLCSTVLLSLPEGKREEFLAALPDEIRGQMQELLTFPESSVGKAMRSDYSAFHEDLTVVQAIERLKLRSRNQRAPSNIFVIDDHNRLRGVIGMRDLVIASESTLLRDIMVDDFVSVGPFEDESTALKTLSGRGFTSLPVIDAQGHLIGVIRATSLLAGAQDAAAQDIQKLFGVSKDERAFSSIGFCLRKRLPWLHINLLTAFMAASVVALFEDIIAKITVLAIYLPVVAGQGGNAGAQSLAVVMRGLVMREIATSQVRRLLIKEGLIGLVNGAVIGLVTSMVAWRWNGNPYLGLVIGLAMVVNLVAAGLAGAAIPILMKRFGLDPAQSSSIVLTTVTDIVGFFAFLGFAVLFQDLLV